jgi:hypothetical protein
MATPWQQVQVNVGISAKTGAATFALDPSALQLVLDTTAGKGSVHLSIPAAALGASATSLQALGITGNTLDFDALFDGQALYAKSPLLKSVVTMLIAGSGSGSLPSGDLTGWLRLATKADLDLLAAGVAGGTTPTPPPVASFDANTLRKALNDNGLTLTFVGTEKHNGADADHVTVAVDVAEALEAPAFDSMRRDQLNQLRHAMKDGKVSFDLWADHGSGRILELDAHLAATGAQAGQVDVAITFSAPSSTSFEAPANPVDVPARMLFGALLQMMGQQFQQ